MKQLLTLALLSVTLYSAEMAPSNLPPAKLPIKNTPLFIFLGSDDNFGQGMPYLLNYFESKVNPVGRGQAATFDGAPARISFYSNTSYMYNNTWMEWHQRALNDGHELGLHTHNHPNVSSTEQAVSEIRKNIEAFGKGVEVWGQEPITFPPETFTGFRSPYLSVSNHVFNALDTFNLRYDCSLEDGMAPGVGVEDFNWPYTMDLGGTEGWNYLYEQRKVRDSAQKHPGVWEIPAYPLFFIPESLYTEYGLTTTYNNGTRDIDNFGYGEINESEDALKMTGLDFDVWYVQKWTPHEFAMTMLYNLKLRLETNRVPLAFGIHSQYYNNDSLLTGIKTFVDTALTFADVRFVTGDDLIDWMENPIGLDGTVGGRDDNVSLNGSTAQRRDLKFGLSLTANSLNVDIAGGLNSKFSIYSAAGRLVQHGNIAAAKSIDISSLSKGVYLFKAQVAGTILSESFLIK